MSRYIRDMELQLPESDVQAAVEDFLNKGGFYQGEWKGEACYTSDYGPGGYGPGGYGPCNSYGQSLTRQVYFFKYFYQNGILHFEAWVRDGKTKEVGLTGAYIFTLKQPYTALVSAMENRLTEMLPAGSDLRTRAEVESKTIVNNSRRMSKGMPLIYALSLIFIVYALINVLRHLGLF